MKWGIQIPFPDWDHWLWVTDNWLPGIVTFDTKLEAERHGATWWKTFRVAEVTNEVKNSDCWVYPSHMHEVYKMAGLTKINPYIREGQTGTPDKKDRR